MPGARALSAAFASAASATPPTSETFDEKGFLTLPDFDCGSFTLHEEMISEDRTVTTFSNQPGVDRVRTHVAFLGEITNSATGETFRDHATLTWARSTIMRTRTSVGSAGSVRLARLGIAWRYDGRARHGSVDAGYERREPTVSGLFQHLFTDSAVAMRGFRARVGAGLW